MMELTGTTETNTETIEIEVPLPRMVAFSETWSGADPDKVLFWRGIQDRDIWLDVEINTDVSQFLIKYIHYLNRAENDDQMPVTLHIDSPGGDLRAALSIYNTIRNSKIPVNTVNESSACSAAFIVFLAGENRTMTQDAIFLMHEGTGGPRGSLRENRQYQKQHEDMVARTKEIVVERTNVDAAEMEMRMSMMQDWYIGYEEAKKLNIITE